MRRKTATAKSRRREDSREGGQMGVHEFRGRQDSGIDEATEDLGEQVLGAAIEVHRVIGPGFPESVYRKALSRELTLRGIAHVCEAIVPIYYKGELVGEGRIDILVAVRIVVELKCVEALTQVHRAQAIAYLQARKLKLAFLINFNIAILKDGIKRVVNTF
jgi:GxxExxY protein